MERCPTPRLPARIAAPTTLLQSTDIPMPLVFRQESVPWMHLRAIVELALGNAVAPQTLRCGVAASTSEVSCGKESKRIGKEKALGQNAVGRFTGLIGCISGKAPSLRYYMGSHKSTHVFSTSVNPRITAPGPLRENFMVGSSLTLALWTKLRAAQECARGAFELPRTSAYNRRFGQVAPAGSVRLAPCWPVWHGANDLKLGRRIIGHNRKGN